MIKLRIMFLPTSLPESQKDRRTLGEFYDTFKNTAWFIKAEFDGKRIEVHATEKPKETDSVEAFVQAKKIGALEWVIAKNACDDRTN